MTQKNVKTAVDLLSLAITAAALTYTACTYSSLPSEIPTHYGITGEADAFGSKSSIWTLFILLAVMHTGLGLLNRFPHIFNYPVKINERHRNEIYLTAQHMLSWTRLLIDITFAALLIETIHATGSVVWLLPLSLVGYPAILIFFIIKMNRINNR